MNKDNSLINNSRPSQKYAKSVFKIKRHYLTDIKITPLQTNHNFIFWFFI
jgi:hypothetical protein